jgi:hypothetical protein
MSTAGATSLSLAARLARGATAAWIAVVLALALLLQGPSPFWWSADRLGIGEPLRTARARLLSVLSAPYQAP